MRQKTRRSLKDKGVARMAFTDIEIAEAHASVRSFAQPEDMYKLGLIYATGQGGEIDLVHAHQWFNLAASRGFEAAKEARRELADMMSISQVAEAQKLAREWLKSNKLVERIAPPMAMAA
jgi:TPR repeat protein